MRLRTAAVAALASLAAAATCLFLVSLAEDIHSNSARGNLRALLEAPETPVA